MPRRLPPSVEQIKGGAGVASSALALPGSPHPKANAVLSAGPTEERESPDGLRKFKIPRKFFPLDES
ncbi:hypothetical protein AAFF_G00049240 [Aldrovandia affinis]|uniref:Uncharacterized protein n=1 Tax=Aldrovandia affinis TaxID=143900 RepID=A0AAD7S168_9TELE|nr:hypothetical protein AAFF_G00049240 [Aldrovandia affinis]